MAKQHLSVIIVPHTKTSTRTLCFSRRALRALAIGGVALGLVLAAVLVDYVRMSVIRGRYKALKVEAAEQRTMISNYEKSISDLQSTISHFESYTKKLNVMAGLKSPDALTAPAGIGGGDPGQAEEPAPESEPNQIPPARGPQVFSPGTVQNLNQKALSIESNLH